MICQNTLIYGKIHHSSTNNWKTKPTSPEELRWNRARESPERPISSPLPDAPSRTRQRERAELTDSPTEPVHCSNETLAKKCKNDNVRHLNRSSTEGITDTSDPPISEIFSKKCWVAGSSDKSCLRQAKASKISSLSVSIEDYIV